MALEVLLIFIKNPQLGQVKTRLAKDLGEEKALEIYLRLLDHTRQQSLAVDVDRRLYYSSFVEEGDDWPSEQFNKYLQEGEDLGQRMSNGFRRAFFDGARKAIIIGSDCAQITAEHLQEAFDALEGRDMVAGPANDGGYYLLGMKRYIPELFRNMEWSTETVLADTMAIARGMNLSVKVLDRLIDVDTAEDWEQVKDLI